MSEVESSESRRYRVLEILGRGGFGTVYRAELLGAAGFSRTVAIKVPNAEAQRDERLIARLRDEARFLGLLHHRAIVQVQGLVLLAGRWAVVLEYVPGCTLQDARRSHGPLPLGVGVEIAEEVASALAEAWEAPGPTSEPLHLLHRDIKPGNIQLTHRGEVKLLDFGIARADMADREGKSGGLVYGSLPYMAPERLEQREGPEADVYALGATLLETIGERLSGNVADSPTRHQIRLEGAVRTLEQLRAPQALVDVILACLAFEPDRRPSARQLEHTLRAIRREIPGVSLRQWAEDELGRIESAAPSAAAGDELSGQVLVEQAPPKVGPLAAARRAELTFEESVALRSLPDLGKRLAERATLRTPAPVPRRAPRETPPPRKSGWLRRLAQFVFWLAVACLVLTAGVGLVAAGTGVAGMAGVAGLIALVWPGVVRDGCVDEFAKADRTVRATRTGRPKDQVLSHLHTYTINDCRAGTIGLWEQVSFGERVEKYSQDGVLSEFEASDLIALYQQIRRP